MPRYQGIVTPNHKVADSVGHDGSLFGAYMTSKVMAYNRTLDFISKEKPHFNVTNVMPVFVVGKNELATTLEAVNAGSNQVALNTLLGVRNPAGMTAFSVHVDDVAKVHIQSLNPRIEGNQNFACSSDGLEGIRWDDAIEIVKKHFPEEVRQGIFPLGGHQASNKLRYDASRTEEIFGFKFKSFEEQVISIAGWYAEIARS